MYASLNDYHLIIGSRESVELLKRFVLASKLEHLPDPHHIYSFLFFNLLGLGLGLGLGSLPL
jgi:hypothetical protein